MKRSISLLFCLFFLTCCLSPKKEPSLNNELRLAIAEDPATLDPRKGGDILSTHIQLMLFEGLVKLHSDGTVTPAQCFSYTISNDQKTYTFTLGKGKWSDGTVVTSYDFAKAWKDILSPTFPAPNAHLLYPILGAKKAKQGVTSIDTIGIHTPDASTLIVELETPTPYFLQLISFCTFSPIHPSNPSISNGPFTLDFHRYNQELVLAKNSHYPDPDAVLLSKIHFSIIRDEMTALYMYEKGEIDLMGSPFFTPPLEAMTFIPEDEILEAPIAATLCICFNTSAFPFSNKHLRQAFSLSIDRKELLMHAEGRESIALSAVPPCLVGKEKKAFPLEGTQEKAKEHLTKALEELKLTLPELEKLLFYFYPSSRAEKKLAELLQQQWKAALGINISLKTSERKVFLDALSHKNYLFAQAIHRAQYCDPLSILERFCHKEDSKNYSCWQDPKYQSLIELSALQSGEERIATLELAESLLLEELPLTPIAHLNLHYLKKPYLCNVELSPAGGIFFERLSFVH
jgi:oligopeptide transport system substrate-binding protein